MAFIHLPTFHHAYKALAVVVAYLLQVDHLAGTLFCVADSGQLELSRVPAFASRGVWKNSVISSQRYRFTYLFYLYIEIYRGHFNTQKQKHKFYMQSQ